MAKHDMKRKKKLLKALDSVLAENTPKYEAVHVVWRDASGVAYAWSHRDEVQAEGAKEPFVHSVGLLVQEAPSYILLALSADSAGNDMWDMVLKIPRENIQCIKKLGKVRF